MKTICWVTPDYFADSDMPIVPRLAKYYNIHWIIVFSTRGNRFKESDFELIRKEHSNVTLEYIHNRIHGLWGLNPIILLQLWNLGRAIKNTRSDVIYFNVSRDSIFDLPFIRWLSKNNTIFTAHQGEVRSDMRFFHLTKMVRSIEYKSIKYVNMFSSSEAAKLHKDYPKINIIQFPLALKDFGLPTDSRPNRKIVRFLSFGTINYAKHLDLLIKAANKLYEQGYHNFKVSINGCCNDWQDYQSLIKYPSIIETDIRNIDNHEIANLFNGSHYFVQPYRVVSQSGPMKIAFFYNLPDIVSNLPGFMAELKEGVNGFSFKSGDVNDLVRAMELCINQSDEEYNALLQRMKDYIAEIYSDEVIKKYYSSMFGQVLNQETK